MLVLSRKVNERIVIGDGIVVTVTKIAGNRVALGVEAPAHCRILRAELEPIVHAFDDPPSAAPTSHEVCCPVI